MSKNNVDLNTLLAMYNGYNTLYQGNDAVQNAAASISQSQNREKAGKALTQYASRIPMKYIEAYKPNKSQLREQQMIALFKAYQNGNVAGNGWRKIDETNNTMDIMQYVLSKDPRFKYEGPIYVSQDDITAVARVSLASKEMVKQVRSGAVIEGVSRWDESISMSQMINSVDALVAMTNVIREQSGQKHLTLNNLLPAEVADIVTRGIIADKVNGIDNFEELSKTERSGILAKARQALAKVLGREDRNNSDIQK